MSPIVKEKRNSLLGHSKFKAIKMNIFWLHWFCNISERRSSTLPHRPQRHNFPFDLMEKKGKQKQDQLSTLKPFSTFLSPMVPGPSLKIHGRLFPTLHLSLSLCIINLHLYYMYIYIAYKLCPIYPV